MKASKSKKSTGSGFIEGVSNAANSVGDFFKGLFSKS